MLPLRVSQLGAYRLLRNGSAVSMREITRECVATQTEAPQTGSKVAPSQKALPQQVFDFPAEGLMLLPGIELPTSSLPMTKPFPLYTHATLPYRRLVGCERHTR